MKKLLLLLVAVVLFSINSKTMAQSNPPSCPQVRFAVLVKTGSQTNPNEYRVKYSWAQGTSSGAKSIQLRYRFSSTDNEVIDKCFGIAPSSPNSGIDSSGTITILNTSTFQVRFYTYTGGTNCGGTVCGTVFFENIPLPVSFKSFNANRNKSNVGLVWETSSESNNKGFQVQRKIGGNDFETIAFVNTKANAGNSVSDLTYSYTDVNASQGVSQYRLLQVDFDGQSKHSDIRSVKGEEQSSKTIVYPNPSSNGKVNVVFEDTRSIRDIQLMDMSGRVVNQWRNQTSNNIQIDNLVPGFYNLRIVDQSTKEQSVEKIIIRKN
jgi:hypothetical protein